MIPARIRNFNLWVRQYGVHISLAIIIVATSVILMLIATSINRFAEQSEQSRQILSELQKVTEVLSENAKSQSEQIDGIDRHLDCIVIFFAQTDRTEKSIADIESCTLKDGETGESVEKAPNSSPSASTTPPSPPQTGTTTQPRQNEATSQNNRPGLLKGLNDFLLKPILNNQNSSLKVL